MLMGVAQPTSGSIELLGLPMPAQGLQIKQQIGLVPDESLLFDHLTGGEFIEFAGRIYGLEQQVARERAPGSCWNCSNWTARAKSSSRNIPRECENAPPWRRR